MGGTKTPRTRRHPVISSGLAFSAPFFDPSETSLSALCVGWVVGRLRSSVSFMVGIVIGSGIFASPGFVLADVGSPGAALVVWSFCGLLTLAGKSPPLFRIHYFECVVSWSFNCPSRCWVTCSIARSGHVAASISISASLSA